MHCRRAALCRYTVVLADLSRQDVESHMIRVGCDPLPESVAVWEAPAPAIAFSEPVGAAAASAESAVEAEGTSKRNSESDAADVAGKRARKAPSGPAEVRVCARTATAYVPLQVSV